MSSRRCTSRSPNAAASIAASMAALCNASPSWLTEPARVARLAACAGLPGDTIVQPSMKNCAPICSATTRPLRAIDPLSGAGTPRFRRRNAVCSVELPTPLHHRIVRPSMM